MIPKTINDKNVATIGIEVFFNNQLTSVVIPNSVTTISGSAFQSNQSSNVTFEEDSNLIGILYNSFKGNEHTISEVTLPDSVAYLACEAFREYVVINKREDLICTSIRS